MKNVELKQVAVIMTCHNRRIRTLKCLEHLVGQILAPHIKIEAFLVDDGCSDGTGDEVKKRFDWVHVIEGDGNLFWGGGMRLAYLTARKSSDYAYFLWLNDDAYLAPDSLQRLINLHQEQVIGQQCEGVVVGKLVDEQGKPYYGGLSKIPCLPYFRRCPVNVHVTDCDTFEGSCVLIPRKVAESVGDIDSTFRHLRGDLDYGLRVVKKGFRIWQIQASVGVCESNKVASDKWKASGITLKQRLASLRHPKYAVAEKWAFYRRHFGYVAVFPILLLYGYIYLTHPIRWLRRQMLNERPRG